MSLRFRSRLLIGAATGLFAMSSSFAIVGPKRGAPKTPRGSSSVYVGSPSTTPGGPDIGAARAVEVFQSKAVRPFVVQWEGDSAQIRMIGAGLTKPYAPDALQAAKAFVTDAAPILGPGAALANLTAETPRDTGLGKQVIFQQKFNGVPVLGSVLAVNLTTRGEVFMAENTTTSVSSISTTPVVSPVRAASIAGKYLLTAPVLFVDAAGSETRLIWRFSYRPAFDQLLVAKVDANSGELLSQENTLQFATGSGKVYLFDPISTPTFASQPINWLDGSGKLTGTYAKAYRYTGQTSTGFTGTQDVNESTLVYNYTKTSTKLPQLQAYYNISKVHDYYKGSFGITSRDSQQQIFTSVAGLANAFFDAASGAMVIGAYGGKDWALDGSVLQHEYTHSVVNAVAKSMADNYSAEPGGMNEGLADYFPCSLADNPSLGQWSGSSMGMTELRNLTNTNRYPDDIPMPWSNGSITYYDFAEVHQTGSVWGPVMWDVRKAIGQTAADQDIFKGLTTLTSVSTFQSAMVAIISADNALYGGTHVDGIRSAMNGRGVYETAASVKYLTSSSFLQTTGRYPSKVKTGYVYRYTDTGQFSPDDYRLFTDMGLHPAYVVGRTYGLFGYTAYPTTKSVGISLRDSAGNLLYRKVQDTSALPTVFSSGATTTYQEIAMYYTFPASLIPTGQSKVRNLKLWIQSYDKVASLVTNSTVPRGTAGGYYTELLAPATAARVKGITAGGSPDLQ